MHSDKAWTELIQLLNVRLLRLSGFPPQFLRRRCTLLPFCLYWIRNVCVIDVFFEFRVGGVVVEFEIFEIELRMVLVRKSKFGNSCNVTHLVQAKVTGLETRHTAHDAIGFVTSARHLLPRLVGMPLLACLLPLDESINFFDCFILVDLIEVDCSLE